MSNKAIFLDRDDTLIPDPGYISDPAQVRLLDGVAEALAAFKAMGYKLIVVSNQSAVARGIVTEKVLEKIHRHLQQLLNRKGVSLDRIYYCPYHPEGTVKKYRKESDSRKPNPGMLLTAADEMDIDLAGSWMIGNGSSDVEAGLRAGCKTILLDNPLHNNQPAPGEAMPDFKAVNMKEAVNIVKKHRLSPDKGGLEIEKPNEAQAVSDRVEQSAPPAEEKRQTQEPAANRSMSRNSEQILKGILDQLKIMQRDNMFGEFSTLRMLAAIVQTLVFFCLLASAWFLIDPNRTDSAVFISLGFAMILQLMALTFYMMQGRK